MARPLTVAVHPARAEIDYLIGAHVNFADIAEHYDLDVRALHSYHRATVSERPNYFARFGEHRLSVFDIATAYAAHQRRADRLAAESVFAISSTGSHS